MRTSEDRSGQLVTCACNTGRSTVLTRELVPVDWHGLPVQVTNGADRSSEVLILCIIVPKGFLDCVGADNAICFALETLVYYHHFFFQICILIFVHSKTMKQNKNSTSFKDNIHIKHSQNSLRYI